MLLERLVVRSTGLALAWVAKASPRTLGQASPAWPHADTINNAQVDWFGELVLVILFFGVCKQLNAVEANAVALRRAMTDSAAALTA